MSVLCSTNCGAVVSLTPYWSQCDGNTNQRRYGYNYLALIKCDYVFTDPTSPAEWTAAVTSGDVVLYPVGKIDIPAPTVDTSNDVDACKTNVAIRQTYAIEVGTYQTKDDYSDHQFHEDLAANAANWRAVWFDCAGAITGDDGLVDFLRGTSATAPTDSVGFEFSVSAPPHFTEGDGQQGRWVWTMEIERSGGSILKTAYFPGILQAIQ